MSALSQPKPLHENHHHLTTPLEPNLSSPLFWRKLTGQQQLGEISIKLHQTMKLLSSIRLHLYCLKLDQNYATACFSQTISMLAFYLCKRKMSGFEHRGYKNYDPTAKVIKKLAEEVFSIVGRDPLIEQRGIKGAQGSPIDYVI